MDLLNSSIVFGDRSNEFWPPPQCLLQIEFFYAEPRPCVSFDHMENYRHPPVEESDVVRRVRWVIDALRLKLPNGLSTSEIFLSQKFAPFDLVIGEQNGPTSARNSDPPGS